MTHPAPVPSESAQPPAPDFEAAQEALELLSEEIGSVWAVEPCEKIQATLDEAESRLSLLEAQNAELLVSLEAAKADTERLDLLNSRGSTFEGMTAATPPRETVWFFKSAKYTDLRAFADAARASRSGQGETA